MFQCQKKKQIPYKDKCSMSISRWIFGRGLSTSNLQFMKRFYQTYQIQQTLSTKLSWSHYCELLIIPDPDRRSFYEKECERSGWSVREMKRQIVASLFERLLLFDGETNNKNPCPQGRKILLSLCRNRGKILSSLCRIQGKILLSLCRNRGKILLGLCKITSL